MSESTAIALLKAPNDLWFKQIIKRAKQSESNIFGNLNGVYTEIKK